MDLRYIFHSLNLTIIFVEISINNMFYCPRLLGNGGYYPILPSNYLIIFIVVYIYVTNTTLMNANFRREAVSF